jgi:hypothetical protein
MDPNRIFVGHRRRVETSTRRDPASLGRPHHRWLAGIVMAGAATATMLLGPAGVATAADCPIADLSCLQNQLDDVPQTVVDTVNGVKDDAATAVDTVVGTVRGLTDPVDLPPVDLPPGGGGSGGGGPGSGTGHHPGGPANGHRHPSASATGATVLTREGGTVIQIGTATSGHADASPAGATDQRSPGTRLREAAAGIAISLLIVLGAMLLFMTIQARLDRRDPKLALAPVTADVVTFT